ncbi:MAG: trk/ktr system potassium uptake protein [Methanothermococcus sp.]|uniref:TrkH family potassium uptake protein n=1 Tax=Methanothermococcus sp. TaxID=2614238 RepID=UPI00258D2366|nr:TrkH family potassium uptake protein [Methanothermococcus sp.]MDK2789757.1 trk/ktr system potassium uptake protein [Methanothermococcus sp.]MDK2986972.1 trk/ktr system potassium uptake protein [Methanothermococcus sp.]
MRVFKKKDIIGILHELGVLLSFIGLIMVIPILVGLYYGETIFYFVYPAMFAIITGLIIKTFTKPVNIMLKHAMVISALSWLMASLVGAIPFSLGLENFSYLDSVFESMSAWTTTGFSLINDVESLPRTLQIWRSMEQWVGGVGVLVMVITILSKAGASAYYRAEAREEKILPSTGSTVRKIWQIYLLYTSLGITLLYLSGLTLWESINICMCGISTGGMSISNDSFPYNSLSKVITILIMFIGGIVSFAVHHKILTGRWINDIQTKVSIPLILFVASVLVISSGVGPLDAVFTVVSAMTSTGYSTVNISDLSNTSLALLIFIMAIGGSTGTTTGGIKLIRLVIMFKSFYYRLKEAVFPQNTVIHKKLGDNPLSSNLIIDSFIIAFAYVFHYLVGALVLISLGYDPYRSIFESVSLVANIGLSVNIVNHELHPFAKLIGIFFMWVGRLEIIPIYVLIILPTILKIKDIKTRNFEQNEN